jgi:polar amino acid transport system ATP-binding protein
MNDGVKILLDRMESNPEDFEKGGNLESIFGIAYINQNWHIFNQEEKDALITEFLTEWGLLEHKDKYSCELSGGQRQRTAIIEQMLSSKHFMILDEPFSGLDVGNIEKVKTSFQKILDADEYNTIIFSTHDIRLAVELADSIYIIGFPEGVTDYSTVVKHYDLKAMGLAWTEYNDSHRAIYNDIKELLLKS